MDTSTAGAIITAGVLVWAGLMFIGFCVVIKKK